MKWNKSMCCCSLVAQVISPSCKTAAVVLIPFESTLNNKVHTFSVTYATYHRHAMFNTNSKLEWFIVMCRIKQQHKQHSSYKLRTQRRNMCRVFSPPPFSHFCEGSAISLMSDSSCVAVRRLTAAAQLRLYVLQNHWGYEVCCHHACGV